MITGASALLCTLPTAGWLLAERGYDADWFRKVLKDEGVMACITGRKSFSREVEYDKKR